MFAWSKTKYSKILFGLSFENLDTTKFPVFYVKGQIVK